MNRGPMVSIWCAVYNHKAYIQDAIEGFLMQKCNFKFEIVVHDDASTDGTIEILRDYKKKYPESIRVIYEEENQYSKYDNPPQYIYQVMRKELKGDYIAWCDGDDYWIDADKLQIQIDYMEQHPNCIMTVHDAIKLNCETGEKDRIWYHHKEKNLSPEDIINASLPTASYVCKREILNLNDFFLQAPVGDYPLQLFCLTKGEIHYFDRAMSVYRCLAEGSWSSIQNRDLNNFVSRLAGVFCFLKRYNDYTEKIYENYIRKEIRSCLDQMLERGQCISVDEFYGICASLRKVCKCDLHKYYTEIIRDFRQYYDKTYFDNGIADFVKKNKYILIWGAGGYGRLLAEQFNNNSIDFEGFIISDDQSETEKCQGKDVWRLSEIPYEKKDIGVVIGVRVELKEEILSVLKSVDGIKNYIYPFDAATDNLLA